jgi:hypothetical protein
VPGTPDASPAGAAGAAAGAGFDGGAAVGEGCGAAPEDRPVDSLPFDGFFTRDRLSIVRVLFSEVPAEPVFAALTTADSDWPVASEDGVGGGV